jgi:glycosyltransferase involved in cell wall biosynthesis
MNQSVARLYNKAFFADQIQGSARSASVVVPHILNLFPRVASVVDVGCGAGVWLREFQRAGVRRVFGIDGGQPSDFLQIDPEHFARVDLRIPFGIKERFDLAICLEVAEHLPAQDAEKFIAQLCNLSDRVVFSAAIPGQGGTGHLNERWPSYWSAIFRQHGYDCHDVVRPRVWFDARVEWWYAQNILVFTKRGKHKVNGNANFGAVLDLVHPRCFEQFREFADNSGYGKPILPPVLAAVQSETISFTQRVLGKLKRKPELTLQPVPSQPIERPVVPYYHPSAPLDAAAKYLFVEFPISHEFLFDVYGSLKGSQLLLVKADDWWIGDRQYDYIRRSCSKQLRAIFLMTLDRHLYNPEQAAFLRFLEQTNAPVTGILHRLPSDPSQLAALKTASKWLRKIFVLSDKLASDVQHLTGGKVEVIHLPHHAPNDLYFQNAADIRSSIGAQSDDVIVSVIGEMRKGKGIDLLLRSLKHLPAAPRRKLFFLFAGKAAAWNAKSIQSYLDQSGVRGYVDVRQSINARDFRVMSNQELVNYVKASDWGALLYREDQRGCASGVLPAYVWARKPILATKNSIIGREVLQSDLGKVLDRETTRALAKLLAQHVSDGRRPHSKGYEKFRTAISKENVVARLRRSLEDYGRRNRGF